MGPSDPAGGNLVLVAEVVACQADQRQGPPLRVGDLGGQALGFRHGGQRHVQDLGVDQIQGGVHLGVTGPAGDPQLRIHRRRRDAVGKASPLHRRRHRLHRRLHGQRHQGRMGVLRQRARHGPTRPLWPGTPCRRPGRRPPAGCQPAAGPTRLPCGRCLCGPRPARRSRSPRPRPHGPGATRAPPPRPRPATTGRHSGTGTWPARPPPRPRSGRRSRRSARRRGPRRARQVIELRQHGRHDSRTYVRRQAIR